MTELQLALANYVAQLDAGGVLSPVVRAHMLLAFGDGWEAREKVDDPPRFKVAEAWCGQCGRGVDTDARGGDPRCEGCNLPPLSCTCREQPVRTPSCQICRTPLNDRGLCPNEDLHPEAEDDIPRLP